MEVKCIVHEYFDVKLNKYVKKDETIEVDAERAKFLIERKFVKPLKEKPKNKES